MDIEGEIEPEKLFVLSRSVFKLDKKAISVGNCPLKELLPKSSDLRLGNTTVWLPIETEPERLLFAKFSCARRGRCFIHCGSEDSTTGLSRMFHCLFTSTIFVQLPPNGIDPDSLFVPRLSTLTVAQVLPKIGQDWKTPRLRGICDSRQRVKFRLLALFLEPDGNVPLIRLLSRESIKIPHGSSALIVLDR